MQPTNTEQRVVTSIKWWNASKGYGFSERAIMGVTAPEAFLHLTRFSPLCAGWKEAQSEIQPGLVVSFLLRHRDDDSKPYGIDIQFHDQNTEKEN